MFLLKPKKGHDNDVLTETQREKLLQVASIALQQANYYTRYASTLERPSDRHAYTNMANVCLDVSLVLERFSEDGGTVRDVTASLPERTIDYLLASDFFICIYGAIPVERSDTDPGLYVPPKRVPAPRQSQEDITREDAELAAYVEKLRIKHGLQARA